MWIYKLTNSVNGKVYVGKTANLRERLQAHARAKDDVLLHRAIRQHGWAAFTVEVLAKSVASESELSRLEMRWIAELRCMDRSRGYNLTAGGEGALGFSPSPETRAAWSAKRKGVQPSALCKERLLEYSRRPKSEETRRRMSEAAKRRGKNTAYQAMMSAATSGVPKSDAHRAKTSEFARQRARNELGEFA